MLSQHMDPNMVLLYECIQSVGVKKIDFKQVGKALGVNAAAARMRYYRLEAKMKSGGIVRSRATSSIRSVGKVVVVRGSSTMTRKKPTKSDTNSTMSLEEDENVPGSDSGQETAEGPTTRTRGVKIKSFKNDDDSESNAQNSGESSADDYDAAAENDNDSGSDEEMSDFQDTTRACNTAKNSARRSQTSRSPPLVSENFGRRQNSAVSHFTPPSSQGGAISKATKIGVTTGTTYDEQIKQDLSALKVGMMLPFTEPSSPLRATSRTSHASYIEEFVEESAILQSIEESDDEESVDAEAGDKEMGDTGGDEDEGHKNHQVPGKSILPPAGSVSKKNRKPSRPGCTQQ